MLTSNGHNGLSNPQTIPLKYQEAVQIRVRTDVANAVLLKQVLDQFWPTPQIDLVEFSKQISNGKADITIVDFTTGDDLTETFRRAAGTRIIAIVSNDSDRVLLQAVSVGIWATVLVDALPNLVKIIEKVQSGKSPILESLASRPTVVRQLLARIKGLSSCSYSGTSNPLTNREANILRRVSDGSNSATIADKLSLSEQTVKNYIGGILRKIGANNRPEAVAKAIRNGWLGES